MKVATYDPPPQSGQRLIPQIIDELAESDPLRVFVSFPKFAEVSGGFRDVNYREFSAAVNRCAWWIEEKLGKDAPSQVIFYMGHLDVRYLIILLGACKAGHVAFMSSHRNSLEAHLSLLEATKCEIIMYPEHAPIVTQQILSERPMTELLMPPLDFLLSSAPVEAYEFTGTFLQRKDETCVILHTSGSTGIPKPVYVTHGTFAGNDAHQLIPSLGGKPTTVHVIHKKRLFLAFPLFHACGINFTIGYGVYANVVCVLPPPGPVTTSVVDDVHTYGNVDGSLIPPSMITDIYYEPTYRANMIEKLEFLAYVGGTLPKEIGDPLSSQLQLITLMGSTETMLLPVELNDKPEDWEYIPVSPFLGAEFRQNRDDLRELVVVRDQKYELFQGVFSTFPDKDEYGMSDLYEQHPQRTNAWTFKGRADDIIAFSNAEKLNPVTMETVISGHPAVKAALIGGQGEFQASLLIEPKVHPADDIEHGQLINNIWPVVMEANKSCPAHGRIMKDYIMFTKPDKPMPRAGKSTVQRYAALNLYAQEFKELYRSSRENDSSNSDCSRAESPSASAPLSSNTSLSSDLPKVTTKKSGEDIQAFRDNSIDPNELDARIEAALHRLLPQVLQQHLGTMLGHAISNLLLSSMGQSLPNGATPMAQASKSSTTHTNETEVREIVEEAISDTTYLQSLDQDTNFFLAGLDSLQVKPLVKEINSKLANSEAQLEPIKDKTVYNNPDLRKLTAAITAESRAE